jgi:phosphoribosylglycinamide formyltransferase-1
MATVKVAVLASGRGSNFKAIVEEIKAGRCDAQIKVLITNNPDAGAIATAKENAIPVEIIDKGAFPDREALDERIKEILDGYGVELVVLAGYMLLLKGKSLLEAYRNRIINIHPALLRAEAGLRLWGQGLWHHHPFRGCNS